MGRRRPGSIGFVVMADPEIVERIVQLGRQQTIAGKCVLVEPFEAAASQAKGLRQTDGAEPSTKLHETIAAA